MEYNNILELIIIASIFIIFVLLTLYAKVWEERNILRLENKKANKSISEVERFYNIIENNQNNIIKELKRENEKDKRIIKFLSDQNIILYDEAKLIPEKIKSEVLTNELIRRAHENFLEVLQTSK